MGAKQAVRHGILRTPAARLFEPGFVITGTGRSGTRYIATLLRQVGIRCGHEQWWTLHERSIRLEGDASWVAAFQLDGYTGDVFHQTRNTLSVIDSLMNGDIQPGTRAWPERTRRVDFTGDPAIDAMAIYVTWIRQAQRVAEWEWKLESLNPHLLTMICETIGHPINEMEAERAIEVVSRQTNQHSRADGHRPITWDDLPDGTLKAEAQDIARHYGYL